MSNADLNDDENIIVGKINGVYGVKGWVKVYSYTDPRVAIAQYSPWYFKQHGVWKAVNILDSKPQAKTVIAKIEGCNDRDAAMLFCGTEVSIRKEQLSSLNNNEYYWRDLIGLRVQNQEKFDFGVVQSLMETGSNDVLIIKSDDGKETLIPWTIGAAIIQVSLENGLIVVDWDSEF